ncbi:VWA-like domain-containing protein [Anaerospora sp.]|uniref:vWA domain-containing protein n=1 Tax=Anaerospora sp. TaxID=1960278 RepID=UPI0028A2C3E2|nr:VWA-like domain-containing protein [Anaerospora sp.]
MKTYFENQVSPLYENAYLIITHFLKEKRQDDNARICIPEDFKSEFLTLVDQVNLSLLEDKNNFYGYFLLQMSRELRFDISSPTAVNFKEAKYVIYFNPIIFLTLTLKQMESSIKHEILHIVSMHLSRAKELQRSYSTMAINIAMDIVVNTYLDHLPPYATTLEWVNLNYALKLLPFEPFGYYVEQIQTALDLLEVVEDETENDSKADEKLVPAYDPEKTHDIWEDSSEIEEETLREFTGKFIEASQKGTIPNYLASILTSLRNSKSELPWNLYLKRLMGTVESGQKKTITRRNRRQPDRMDLRGQLRSHKAKIAIALDISGSISDEEFNQAIKEVLSIVKNYNHELTLIECDNEIRRVYQVKSAKDIKARSTIRGGTRFTPVFEYANTRKFNLLVYFTDGKGENKLLSIPRGYQTLWVISGRGDRLSLEKSYGVVKKLSTIEIKDNSLDLSDVEKGGYSMNNQERIGI